MRRFLREMLVIPPGICSGIDSSSDEMVAEIYSAIFPRHLPNMHDA